MARSEAFRQALKRRDELGPEINAKKAKIFHSVIKTFGVAVVKLEANPVTHRIEKVVLVVGGGIEIVMLPQLSTIADNIGDLNPELAKLVAEREALCKAFNIL